MSKRLYISPRTITVETGLKDLFLTAPLSKETEGWTGDDVDVSEGGGASGPYDNVPF